MKGDFCTAVFFFKKKSGSSCGYDGKGNGTAKYPGKKKKKKKETKKKERYQPGCYPTAKVLGYHEHFFGQNTSHCTMSKYSGLPELCAAQIRGRGGTARLSLYVPATPPSSDYKHHPVISSR